MDRDLLFVLVILVCVVSEFLPFMPEIKANGNTQAVVNGIKKIIEAIKKHKNESK